MFSLEDFLNDSPTPLHATSLLCEALESAGFEELSEAENWSLTPGGRYYVTRNESSVVAFRLAQGEPLGRTALAVAHTDSPSLKLRLADAEALPNGTLRIPVEVYGCPSIPTWLDRPLRVCGRIARFFGERFLGTELVDSGEAFAVIPNPPIHFVDLNGGHKYNEQTQLAAILPFHSLNELYAVLLPASGASEDFQAELFLADAQELVVLGRMVENSLIQSSRLDNLTSCYALLEALCEPDDNSEQTVIGGFFDLEEVGLNYQSAGSNFLPSVIARIAGALDGDTQAVPQMMANSTCLSLDVAHAFHPNFPDLFDAKTAPLVGKGPAIKHHANQSYATNFLAENLLRECARKGGLPLQEFTPRSDSRCGSTIGRLVAGSLGCPVVDIGTPIWAMHSCRETGSPVDVKILAELLKSFFAG